MESALDTRNKQGLVWRLIFSTIDEFLDRYFTLQPNCLQRTDADTKPKKMSFAEPCDKANTVRTLSYEIHFSKSTCFVSPTPMLFPETAWNLP